MVLLKFMKYWHFQLKFLRKITYSWIDEKDDKDNKYDKDDKDEIQFTWMILTIMNNYLLKKRLGSTNIFILIKTYSVTCETSKIENN